ncbi:MAG: chromosome segregation protein SMC [Dehalococcoidia bacterium]
MYLKRLDLHGFKSFATSTTLEFGPGVTCVAGPNGSGKTNVAEAIRWVLGEQASRVIRARKTEDVIFSGSAKRSQMGMAEIRITLDNADGWLPLDYGEVVVARRAFRSGENEYYLNQSRVRLRDLNELFLKAQVGQNSYAFMGQGLVEQVLTLRPEERRGLIEEAADVKLHREKLDEARSRLAATRDNLGRVELIVAEIEPRLRQLERQAERATSYARLSSELAQALQALFGQQWQDAQEALAAARAVCDQRQEEFDTARRQVEAHEEGLASLASAIDERRRDIAQREVAYRAIEEYRRDLERRISIDEERQAMLEGRRDELIAEISALRGEREQVVALGARQDERSRELEEALAQARTPDADMQEFNQLESRLSQLRLSLEEVDNQAAKAGVLLVEANARSTAINEQQRRLTADLESIDALRGEQILLLKAWAREFAGRRTRSVELTPLAQRATRTLDETKTRLDRAALVTEHRRAELRTLNVEMEAAEARLDAAQGTDIDLPAADAGVEAVLAAGGKLPGREPPPEERIHGLVGMLGQLIRVPQGLERAIEAALADSLHAVVVETQEDALAAIELLVAEDKGRATIYPLSDIRPGHPLNLMEERGVLGVASDLVRCDGRFRPLVNALLGRTIVVQNVGIAQAVLRRGMGNVVTLDGALLQPVGSMTAGSARIVRRALAHQRDVGELPAELERMRARHKEATTELEGADRERHDAQRAYDSLAPESERLQSELTAADEALRQHRSRLPTTAARLSALHARRRDERGTLAQSQGAFAEARAERERAAADVQEHAAEQRRLHEEIEEVEAARATLVQATAGRTSRIAALEAEREAFQQQASIQAGAIARVEGELARRTELATRLEADLQSALDRLEAARRELNEKTAESETAREELEPARRSLEQIESRRAKIDEELGGGRSASLATERALLDAEANVRLRSEELDALRDRLAEEGFRPSDEGDVVRDDEVVHEDEGGEPPAWLTVEQRSSDDEPPPMRGGAQVDATALKGRINELRADIRGLGPVNEQAATDFTESRERYEFLSTQTTDLREAEAALLEAIEELETIIKERFSTTFRQVNKAYQHYFETFFGGGSAELLLTKPDEAGLPGIDIIAQPPRKNVRTINMLSGGERSLTAVALLFALLETHPSPICVLDEVDAALDEANVDRFTNALRKLAERTQFIIITHNRRTIEMADTIYGISMGEDSTSSVLSLRLSDIPAK